MKTLWKNIGVLLLPAAVLSAQEAADAALARHAGDGVSFADNGQQPERLAARGVALADFTADGFLDAFVASVLAGPKLWITGGADELEDLA
jgi:hypothetical protein